MNGELMRAEIAEQPAMLGRILHEGAPLIRSIAERIRRRRPRFVLFAARGTSDHAAVYAKYLVETRLCLPAGLFSPSTVTLYDAHPVLDDVLVVAVSQSGASPDLGEVVQRARKGGAITLAVTNAPDSPLARAAEYHLDVLAGPERAVAATKTYTAQLLTLFLLVEALRERDGEEARLLPERADTALGMHDAIQHVATRYRFAEQLVVTARGYNYCTALEAALKLMETTYVVAHAFSSADLLHGPMAMIDRGFPVIAIAPGGLAEQALDPVIDRLCDLGAETLIVGEPGAAARGTLGLPLADIGPEVVSPILTILPLQLLAWYLARERRIDPDQPRGLRKITETR